MSRFYLAIVCLFFSTANLADQLIVEPEMGRAPIIAFMAEAKHSLQLVMYGFTDETLLNTLLVAHDKNKTIQLILEQAPYKAETQNQKTIGILQKNNINMQGRGEEFKLVHQKTLIADNQRALVMTFNFTRSTFKNERNFGLIIDDPHTVHAISALFAADWHRVPANIESNRLIVSPDNSRRRLLSLIENTRDSLQIYAQSLKDFEVLGALSKAAKRGVIVNIITSSDTHSKQANFLRRAGVHIKQSKKRYIHAKVFIIDHRIAIIGSINLTRPSLDHNRELSILSEDKTVLDQLSKIFDQDFGGTPLARRKSVNIEKLATRYLFKTLRAIRVH